jgi:hypothetical protein
MTCSTIVTQKEYSIALEEKKKKKKKLVEKARKLQKNSSPEGL